MLCICHQYSGCQLIKDSIKGQIKYYCTCQFQDSFNLWELNEIKREINKLKNYCMDIMVAVCEINKVTAWKIIFGSVMHIMWLRLMVYILILMTWKNFYFNYRPMNVNLVWSCLLLVMIEICSGLPFDNAQLFVAIFCFGYYLGKRRPQQGYVEINDFIFRLKK